MADEKKKEMAEKLTAYGRDKVEKVIRPMLQDVFLATPEDPVQFMIDWLNEYRERGVSSARGVASERAQREWRAAVGPSW
jgi:hypothetical protein